ncbi:MAG: hypothetical protein V9G20_27995 [Candidatus Promineifilaceae bacterium]
MVIENQMPTEQKPETAKHRFNISLFWRGIIRQASTIALTALIVWGILQIFPAEARPNLSEPQNGSNAVSSSFTTIPYAGFLTDSNGNPITQPQTLRFSIWDQPSIGSGNQLWPDTGIETHNSVPFQDGYFSVMLGSTSGNAFTPDIFTSNQNYYLQIQVGNEILTPRQQLGAVPGGIFTQDILPETATHAETVSFGPDAGTPSTVITDTFVNIPGYEVTITTDGGPVLLMFQANIRNSATSPAVAATIDFTMDGVSVSGASNGVTRIINATNFTELATVFWLVPTTTSGSHTFRVQWKATTGGQAQINQNTFATQFSAIEFRR